MARPGGREVRRGSRAGIGRASRQLAGSLCDKRRAPGPRIYVSRHVVTFESKKAGQTTGLIWRRSSASPMRNSAMRAGGAFLEPAPVQGTTPKMVRFFRYARFRLTKQTAP